MNCVAPRVGHVGGGFLVWVDVFFHDFICVGGVVVRRFGVGI